MSAERNSRAAAAKRIQDRIRQVLLREWDPLEIRAELKCQDEYDAYIGTVYRLLVAHAKPDLVAEALAEAEHHMGVQTSSGARDSTVKMLLKLDVALTPPHRPVQAE